MLETDNFSKSSREAGKFSTIENPKMRHLDQKSSDFGIQLRIPGSGQKQKRQPIVDWRLKLCSCNKNLRYFTITLKVLSSTGELYRNKYIPGLTLLPNVISCSPEILMSA